jgi:hypothetical protein
VPRSLCTTVQMLSAGGTMQLAFADRIGWAG